MFARRVLVPFSLLLLLLATGCPSPEPAKGCVSNTDCALGSVCKAGTCAASCTPRTCADLGKNCGEIDDGCGGTLSCGSCTQPETCGGGGTVNVCGQGGCSETDAQLCTRMGRDCGTITALDLCGMTRQVACGSCSGSETCGGGGTPNVCGAACVPESDSAVCARYGKSCDSFTGADNCGASRTVNCGSCTGGNTCGGGGTPNVCGQSGCTSETNSAFCSRLTKNCGVVTANDNCGVSRSVNCGTCTSPMTCGSTNVCACVPETDAEFCTRLALNCGSVTGSDNCGQQRTVANCGTCSGGQLCTNNSCGCGTCGANAHCDATAQACVCDSGYLGDGQSCGLQSRCEGRVESATGDYCHYSPVAAGSYFNDVYGASSSSVFAVSDTAIFRFDGSRWFVESTTPNASAVWASSATDAWAVSSDGFVLHRTATGWSNITPEAGLAYYGVWGSSANDVWVVGSYFNGTAFEGIAFRWNGTSWSSRITVSTTFGLNAVWGTSANDVWAVGDSCTVMRWNGTTWSPTTLPTGVCSGSWLTDVSGSSSSDVWLLKSNDLIHWNGVSWTLANLGFSPRAVRAVSGTDAWVSGYSSSASSGLVSRWNGSTWTSVSMPAGTGDLRGIWGNASGDAWAVGSGGTMIHRVGGTFEDAARLFVDPPYAGQTAISGSGPANVMISTAQGIFRWNGLAWAAVSGGLPSLSTALPGTIDVVDSNTAFVQVNGTSYDVYRWNGTSWSSTGLNATQYVSDISMLSATDGWAVGSKYGGGAGSIYRWNGTSWSSVANPSTNTVDRVWASSANEAWAVDDGTGSGSEVLHWNGTSWATVTTSVIRPKFVTGSGAGDVWSIDYLGRAYHRTATTFTKTITSSGADTNFNHLISHSATDAWGVGNRSVYHWDGTNWTNVGDALATTSTAISRSIWRSAAGDIWVIGSNGTLVTNKQ